ncbi:hypothetical protein HK101_000725 [Irineochytrium annulatum]|nr:hypothetical protein HK101_000725 [Irineochytrium annulatum]
MPTHYLDLPYDIHRQVAVHLNPHTVGRLRGLCRLASRLLKFEGFSFAMENLRASLPARPWVPPLPFYADTLRRKKDEVLDRLDIFYWTAAVILCGNMMFNADLYMSNYRYGLCSYFVLLTAAHCHGWNQEEYKESLVALFYNAVHSAIETKDDGVLKILLPYGPPREATTDNIAERNRQFLMAADSCEEGPSFAEWVGGVRCAIDLESRPPKCPLILVAMMENSLRQEMRDSPAVENLLHFRAAILVKAFDADVLAAGVRAALVAKLHFVFDSDLRNALPGEFMGDMFAAASTVHAWLNASIVAGTRDKNGLTPVAAVVAGLEQRWCRGHYLTGKVFSKGNCREAEKGFREFAIVMFATPYERTARPPVVAPTLRNAARLYRRLHYPIVSSGIRFRRFRASPSEATAASLAAFRRLHAILHNFNSDVNVGEGLVNFCQREDLELIDAVLERRPALILKVIYTAARKRKPELLRRYLPRLPLLDTDDIATVALPLRTSKKWQAEFWSESVEERTAAVVETLAEACWVAAEYARKGDDGVLQALLDFGRGFASDLNQTRIVLTASMLTARISHPRTKVVVHITQQDLVAASVAADDASRAASDGWRWGGADVKVTEEVACVEDDMKLGGTDGSDEVKLGRGQEAGTQGVTRRDLESVESREYNVRAVCEQCGKNLAINRFRAPIRALHLLTAIHGPDLAESILRPFLENRKRDRQICISCLPSPVGENNGAGVGDADLVECGRCDERLPRRYFSKRQRSERMPICKRCMKELQG